jgi:hypothetical protein
VSVKIALGIGALYVVLSLAVIIHYYTCLNKPVEYTGYFSTEQAVDDGVQTLTEWRYTSESIKEIQ